MSLIPISSFCSANKFSILWILSLFCNFLWLFVLFLKEKPIKIRVSVNEVCLLFCHPYWIVRFSFLCRFSDCFFWRWLTEWRQTSLKIFKILKWLCYILEPVATKSLSNSYVAQCFLFASSFFKHTRSHCIIPLLFFLLFFLPVFFAFLKKQFKMKSWTDVLSGYKPCHHPRWTFFLD